MGTMRVIQEEEEDSPAWLLWSAIMPCSKSKRTPHVYNKLVQTEWNGRLRARCRSSINSNRIKLRLVMVRQGSDRVEAIRYRSVFCIFSYILYFFSSWETIVSTHSISHVYTNDLNVELNLVFSKVALIVCTERVAYPARGNERRSKWLARVRRNFSRRRNEPVRVVTLYIYDSREKSKILSLLTVVTGFNTWFHDYDPQKAKRSVGWLHSNETVPPKLKLQQSVVKFAAIYSRDGNSIIFTGYFPCNIVTTSIYDGPLMSKLHKEIKEKG